MFAFLRPGDRSRKATPEVHMPEREISAPNIELAKLQIERDKLDIERQKLLVEQYKARWSAYSVAIPLLVVAATVGLGVWNQYQQNRQAFTLKAAEILMTTPSPNETRNKANALLSLFPNQLPKNFASSFDPSTIVTAAGENFSQRELRQLLTANPDAAVKILNIWLAIYPDDPVAKELQNKLTPNPALNRTRLRGAG
jgi:hypothetical protein